MQEEYRVAANNIELNPLTSKPYSPVDVLMDMQLLIGKYRHRVSKSFWRIELCPPPEECHDWTQGQWQKFLNDCVHVLDATEYNGKHTMLTQSQYIAACHFETGNSHIHIVSNRMTTNGIVQDTHKCIERARRAANIIAKKYGWSTAEERSNARMARIHEAAIKILRGMESWDIETYFSAMRSYGFEVDPVYDKHGVCRGYSVGEKLYDLDGNYSSTVMYKVSNKNFGHARDLTVSKLYSTWLTFHPQKEETHTEKVPVPDKTTTTGNGIGKSDPLPVQPEADLVQNHTQTDSEKERERAIWRAIRAIEQYIERPFRMRFTPRDLEDSQQQGDNDGRQDNNILQKSDGEYSISVRERHQPFVDQVEYQQRVKVVIEGKLLGDLVRESITMLEEQLKALGQVPIDSMRNNANKLVNQDIGIGSLEDMNKNAAKTLHTVARAIHDSSLMSRYVEELTKAEREKWQLTEADKAMIKGCDKACESIEEKVESHLDRMATQMEWFPIAYHIVDKVALVVLPVLAYYTGKYNLDDTMFFLWLVAAMPVLAISILWAINELRDWVVRKKRH